MLRALELIGPAAATAATRVREFLIEGQPRAAPPVRLAAIRALARIAGVSTQLVSPLADLARAARDDEQLFPLAVDALAKLGPPARDAVLELATLSFAREHGAVLDGPLVEFAVADPSVAGRLPLRLGWLRGWLTGTPHDRSEAIAYARRRLLPSLEFGFPTWHSSAAIDEILAVRGLARELGPVWRIVAAAREPELVARGLYGRWLAGEGLDVSALRRRLHHAVRVSPEGFVTEYLRAIELVGRDAAALRPEVEEIRDRTRDLGVLDAARSALAAIESGS